MLAQISDGFNSAIAERNESERNLNEIKTANESLREANMKLFLRVGKNIDNSENGDEKQVEENKKLSFDDLFSEKGELK